MTDTPTRWRWNPIQGLTSRFVAGSDRPEVSASRCFVLRPHTTDGSWEHDGTRTVLTWYGGQSSAARMTIRLIEAGDELLLLNADRRRALVGVARVVRPTYPAPTSDEPSRLAIDLELIRHFVPAVQLNRLRVDARISDSPMLRTPTPELVRLSGEQRRALKRHGID